MGNSSLCVCLSVCLFTTLVPAYNVCDKSSLPAKTPLHSKGLQLAEFAKKLSFLVLQASPLQCRAFSTSVLTLKLEICFFEPASHELCLVSINCIWGEVLYAQLQRAWLVQKQQLLLFIEHDY